MCLSVCITLSIFIITNNICVRIISIRVVAILIHMRMCSSILSLHHIISRTITSILLVILFVVLLLLVLVSLLLVLLLFLSLFLFVLLVLVFVLPLVVLLVVLFLSFIFINNMLVF